MLQPDKDRLDLGLLLSPPIGFQVDKAIATCYSLDLDALISIPIALCFSTTLEFNVTEHIVEILEAIRRTSESIKIYCQKGQIKVPQNQHRLYHFIEKCLVQVPPKPERSFHPKVWIIRFKGENAIRYRIIVMSRNLTFDRSWDVVFQVEGEVQPERKNSYGRNRPLVDFAKYLVNMSPEDWSAQFLADLGKVQFTLDGQGIDEFDFLPMGIPKYSGEGFLSERYDQLAVVSPFVSKTGLTYLLGHCKGKPTLFTRLFEIRKLKDHIKERLDIYHLDHAFVEAEENMESDTNENEDQQHQDLHAKIYCGKSGWNATLYLGSANCSHRALTRNVEFMVRLKGRDSRIGPKVFCDELLNTGWFFKYAPNDEITIEEEELCNRQQLLQDLRVEFANILIEANAARHEEGTYCINLRMDLSQITCDQQIKASCYLLNAENHERSLLFGEINEWEVRHLAELDLSSFLIIRLQDNKSHAESEFAIKIIISGLPESRGNRIFSDIISNSHLFFKYLRFLLAENLWEEQDSGSTNTATQFGFGSGQFNLQEEPIYENMLKAISREPQKLLEIRQVMEKIASEDTDAVSIIPANFKVLWDIFENTLSTVK
ncbi:phospholipase D family protein [Mucilaginibacter flavus]|uniref:phospholipase D family protein n=1 Tax=Mucilaginibacter flavus TaxID=931504 RepID=UPI0025B4A5D4|nr:phospholipase D family protein [Mucilaginibacter flavus]MDN3585015.1 phospholipase D family protein [Mucilaginibacter flavus]